jgi:hypothetical protein
VEDQELGEYVELTFHAGEGDDARNIDVRLYEIDEPLVREMLTGAGFVAGAKSWLD